MSATFSCIEMESENKVNVQVIRMCLSNVVGMALYSRQMGHQIHLDGFDWFI